MKIGILYDDNGSLHEFILNEDSYKITEVAYNGELCISDISLRDGEYSFVVSDDSSVSSVKLERKQVDHKIKFSNTEVDIFINIVRSRSCEIYSFNGLKTETSTEVFKKN